MVEIKPMKSYLSRLVKSPASLTCFILLVSVCINKWRYQQKAILQSTQ